MNHCAHPDSKLYQQACSVVASSLSPLRLGGTENSSLQPSVGAGSWSTRQLSGHWIDKERLLCQQSTLRATLNEASSPSVLSGVLCCPWPVWSGFLYLLQDFQGVEQGPGGDRA